MSLAQMNRDRAHQQKAGRDEKKKQAGTSRAAALKVQEVPLALIDQDVKNHRETLDGIDGLAVAIERDGLRQPIEVWRKPNSKRYTLAFGFRRLAAFKKLKREKIPAHVVPAEQYDKSAIRQVQAVENIERDELSPVEEAMALASIIDCKSPETLDDKSIAQTVDDIAAKIGRPKRYVEDRIRLARLCPEVRDMVQEGKLALGFALVVARLGDPDEQKSLAQECSPWHLDYHGKWEHTGQVNLSIERAKSRVEYALTSLRGVPWNLDVAFGGKPACTGCEHNADNQTGLFASADEKSEDSQPTHRCLNPRCFKSKQAITEKRAGELVAKFVKLKVSAKPEIAEACAKSPHVKVDTIVRRVRKELDSPAAHKRAARNAGKGPWTDRGNERHQSPQEKFSNAWWTWWHNKYENRLRGVIGQSKGRAILAMMISLLRNLPYADHGHGPGDQLHAKAAAALKPLLKLLTSPTIENLDTVVRSIDKKQFHVNTQGGPFYLAIGDALGIDRADEPTLEEFQSKVETEVKLTAKTPSLAVVDQVARSKLAKNKKRKQRAAK